MHSDNMHYFDIHWSANSCLFCNGYITFQDCPWLKDVPRVDNLRNIYTLVSFYFRNITKYIIKGSVKPSHVKMFRLCHPQNASLERNKTFRPDWWAGLCLIHKTITGSRLYTEMENNLSNVVPLELVLTRSPWPLSLVVYLSTPYQGSWFRSCLSCFLISGCGESPSDTISQDCTEAIVRNLRSVDEWWWLQLPRFLWAEIKSLPRTLWTFGTVLNCFCCQYRGLLRHTRQKN